MLHWPLSLLARYSAASNRVSMEFIIKIIFLLRKSHFTRTHCPTAQSLSSKLLLLLSETSNCQSQLTRIWYRFQTKKPNTHDNKKQNTNTGSISRRESFSLPMNYEQSSNIRIAFTDGISVTKHVEFKFRIVSLKNIFLY